MFWMLYGVKPAGRLGSVNEPASVVGPNVELNTSIVPAAALAA